MSTVRHIPLILFGAGRVSRALLSQLANTQENIEQRYGLRLVPVGLVDTSGALFDGDGLSSGLLNAVMGAGGAEPVAQLPAAQAGVTPLDTIQRAQQAGIEQAIVIDATTADDLGEALHHSLDLGYGIVLANKRSLAGPWQNVRRFFETSYARFEATVGAGLPVITTLRYLVDTGDDVRYIEGTLSRTLEYICGRLEAGQAFSTAANEAVAKGFTESELRQDLSGMDVARKALILARLVGWPLELSDIQVNPLYRSEMARLTDDEFLAALPRLNPQFAAYMGASTGVPRYIAEIRPQGGSVALRMVNRPYTGQPRGPLNHVAVTTRRYADYPLTLGGPGEGIEVTAAAVLQDCMQVASRLVFQ